jgi:thymidylate synthase
MVKNLEEEQYLDLLKLILKKGAIKGDRTGVGTKSIFGHQMRFDLSKGFPLLTTKKVFHKSIFHELIWFLNGDTNLKYLVDNNVKIWNEWPFTNYLKENKLTKKFPRYSKEWEEKLNWFVNEIKTNSKNSEFVKKWGDCGPIYGYQWRNFNGENIDQIKKVIDQIKKTPNSRRLVVSAWNPLQIDEMAKSGLPPCHTIFQFYVNKGKLSCQLYQRSCDVFLGVPFNIASYALLIHIIAKICNLKVGEFIHTLGDVHIYKNHFKQVKEQLKREPFKFCKLEFNKDKDFKKISDFKFEDIQIKNYKSHKSIKAPIAV